MTHPSRTESAPSALAGERCFRALIENSLDAFLLISHEGIVLYANPAITRLLGYLPGPVVGQPAGALVHPDDLPAKTALVAQLLAAPGRHITQVLRLRHASGEWRWVEVQETNLLHDPAVAALVANFRDVSDRIHAEEALRQSESRFRALAEGSAQVFWFGTLCPERVLYVSPAFERVWGRTAEEIYRSPRLWLEASHPDDRARVCAAFEDWIADRAPSFDTEYRVIRPDGSVRWVLDTGVTRSLAPDGSQHISGIATDITERKEAEEERLRLQQQVQEAQRLDGLGMLAGGIAHDFNNLLTAILGYSSLIDMALPTTSPLRGHLAQIEQASRRAADLCQQLLAYAGKGRFIVGQADLSSVVRDTVALMHLSISKKATLELRLASGLPLLEADLTQLRQVIMNLVLNASEALGDRGGLITVSTSLMSGEDISPGLSAGTTLEKGDHVALAVSDTGCGMDEATQARIFEPFFSTKFLGRGLGLAAVLGIVRAHKGAIQVESAPGQGSTFLVLFPISAVTARPVVALPSALEGEPLQGTVLVVEDEAAIRALAAGILEGLGLHVLQAGDGHEALSVLRRHPGPLQLVLLDLTMPHLGGEEVLRELQKVRPQLPVVLMSGYSEREVSHRFAENELAGFLQKPFSRADLTSKVRSALRSA
jgi:PAS domain S-box-containing protein